MFRDIEPDEVAPGDTIVGETGRIVVEEVAKRADGTSLTGRPPGRITGRRAVVRLAPGHLVRVVNETAEAAEVVREALRAGVGAESTTDLTVEFALVEWKVQVER